MKPRRHAVIPDGQVKPGVPISHFKWAGKYLAAKQPDVIINLGDLYDMESLCEYDRASKPGEFMRRRYQSDLDCGDRALDLFDNELARTRGYKPMKLYLLGNHDGARYERMIDADPRLEGAVRPPWEKARENGWRVFPYMQEATIDGVVYCHLFTRGPNGRPSKTLMKWGQPSAAAQVRREMRSCTAGHKPGLDVHIQGAGGRRIRGLVAGSFYAHLDSYLGPQANSDWRGILMKHEVKDGWYDLMEVSLDYLKRRFSR